MKKFVAGMLSFCMMATLIAGCNGGETTPTTAAPTAAPAQTEGGDGGETDAPETEAPSGDKIVINLWSFTDEVPKMIDAYMESHPDFAAQYEVVPTIIATTNGEYQPALDQALINGGDDAPDFYCCEAAFIARYTQGEMGEYACPYSELGIDVAAETSAANIAQYTMDIGSNTSGELVALGYQATGGAMIYRRSIATEVFGTDDPDEIANVVGAGSGNWDAFYDAAAQLHDAGYATVSSIGDLWNVVKNAPGTQGWVTDDDTLYLDPNRESFLDLAKDFLDNDWCNDTSAWGDAWFADMADASDRQVFCFFGPAWLINYTIAPHCGSYDESGENLIGSYADGLGTYGDWACCPSPVGFFWGGTWVLANVNSDKKEAVGELIRWITLDCSESGLQYAWANGLMNAAGTGDCVASGTVMDISDGSTDFLGGQNMFDVFVPANALASGESFQPLDEDINTFWQDQVSLYAHGEKDRDTAIADFFTNVEENLEIAPAE